MSSRLTAFVLAILLSIPALPAIAAATPPANGAGQDGNAPVRFFPETGHSIAGNFRDYFENRGSLDAFGFPRTDAVVENGMEVQYFQRARMEWHADTNQVQLSLLGSMLTAGRNFPTSTSSPTTATSRYFPETSHTVRQGFLAFFNARGGIDQFGLPISEELTEDGFQVQWFQRARFEWHPELAGPYKVSLTLLGDKYITANMANSPLVPAAARPQLIAEGASNFANSPDNRVFNIKLMAKRLNGVVVAPGATFSFDQVMGDISAAAGWAVGLVILDHETQDGLGGGICQVSTTAFRAAFWAGLPIPERHDHSYPVPYYTQGGAPEGFDATVWSPDLDFKFVNDTGAPLTITTRVDTPSTQLFVDLYGKPTGRKVDMLGPVISNRQPHPADKYVFDPKLPAGDLEQTDYAHDGFDVALKRNVTMPDGSVKTDSFPSHYVPWQAIFRYGPGGLGASDSSS